MKHRTGYLFKRGANYYINWRISGRLFSKALRDDRGRAITSMREAQTAQARFMAGLAVADEKEVLQSIAQRIENHSGQLDAMRASATPPLSFTAAWSAFLASDARKRMRAGEETLSAYEYQFQHFGQWIAATHPEVEALRDVTPSIADAYKKHLVGSKRSPGTVNKYLSCLELVFRTLKSEAQIQDNPWTADAVGRESLDTTGREAFTADEVRLICDRADDDLRPLFAVAAMSGLRLKDCCLLRWSEVDMAAGELRVVPAKTRRFGHGRVVVPMPQPLQRLLAGLSRDSSGYVLPKVAARYNASKRQLVKDIQRHIAACGIETRGVANGEGRRAPTVRGFHSFRHWFVSQLLQGGTSLLRVRKMAGHSSQWMQDRYAHVLDMGESRKAVALLADTIENGKSEAAPDLKQVRALVETLAPENANDTRAKLLALLA
jgi:integrase